MNNLVRNFVGIGILVLIVAAIAVGSAITELRPAASVTPVSPVAAPPSRAIADVVSYRAPSPTFTPGETIAPTRTSPAALTPAPTLTPTPVPSRTRPPTRTLTPTSTPQILPVWTPGPAATGALTPGFTSAADMRIVSTEWVGNGPYHMIAWSPNGKKALITKNFTYFFLGQPVPAGSTNLGDMWLWDMETGQQRLLLDQVGQYSWSPDSIHVAFMKPLGAQGPDSELRVLNVADGQSVSLVSFNILDSERFPPQWLAAGEIAYVRDVRQQTVTLDGLVREIGPGLKLRRPLRTPADEPDPMDPDETNVFRYSPDGKRVAYVTPREVRRSASLRLWLADADGSNPTLVTEQAEGGYHEWSPDSQWLVFNTYRDVDDLAVDEHLPSMSGLWVVRADGSDVHPLHRTEG